MATKICSKCKVEKQYSEFGKQTDARDGLKSACKVCRRKDQSAYYWANRERILEKNRSPLPETNWYKEDKLIILSRNTGEYYTVLFDKEDYDKIKDYRWYIHHGRNTKYVVTWERNNRSHRSMLSMHRVILDIVDKEKDKHVDHKNNDGLDNRKQNLRICTAAQNSWNVSIDRFKTKNSTSIYKGVRKFKPVKKRKKNGEEYIYHYPRPWNARIKAGPHRVDIGLFETEEEAARAYDAKALELHGEYAYLNFPVEKNT